MSDTVKDWLEDLDEQQRREAKERLDALDVDTMDDLTDRVREAMEYDVRSDQFSEDDYEQMVQEVWEDIRELFNYPMVRDVQTTSSLLDGTTAAYRFEENMITVSTMFMDRLALQLEEQYDDPDRIEEEMHELTGAIEKHEVGHYTEFPRDLKNWLVLLKRAEDRFGSENAGTILNLYADRVDEASIIQSGLGGEDIQKLWKTMIDADESYYDEIGEEPPSVNRNRLMASIYQEIFPALPGMFEPTETEQDYLEDLTGLNYLPGLDAEQRADSITDQTADDEDEGLSTIEQIDVSPLRWHERNLIAFGEILEELYENELSAENAPHLPGQAGEAGDHDDGEGRSMPGAPGDLDKPGPLRPFGGEGLEGLPNDLLNDALDRVLREEGRGRYRDIREWLDEKVDGFDDRYEADEDGEGTNAGAGIGHADFDIDPSDIPFYKRWASQFPLYIADKPMTTDESVQYRSGRKSYEIGDDIQETNIFASLGLIGTPGVSQLDETEAGQVPDEEYGTPDLIVGIDSSGSMEDPSAHMDNPNNASEAVLASYILGMNYFANRSDVGGYNFSTNMAFKKPDRELDEFYELMAGYWGGGTVVDTEKLEEFIAGMSHLDDVVFTDEEDYEDLVNRMPKQYQDRFTEKDVDINIHEVAGTYERLDHVLITDGMLGNMEETIGYMNEISDYTRNYVFLTGDDQYERWQDLQLENTWLFKATEEDDLTNLAVGLSQDLHDTEDYN